MEINMELIKGLPDGRKELIIRDEIEQMEIKRVETKIREAISNGRKKLQIESLDREMIFYLKMNGCEVMIDERAFEPMRYDDNGYQDLCGTDTMAPEVYNIDISGAKKVFIQKINIVK